MKYKNNDNSDLFFVKPEKALIILEKWLWIELVSNAYSF